MGRGFWWISTGIMLVLFLPLGLILLAVTILKEINGTLFSETPHGFSCLIITVPNLFNEGKGVVAEGYLKDRNFFQATKILAKHDENYMPPEVKAALEEK